MQIQTTMVAAAISDPAKPGARVARLILALSAAVAVGAGCAVLTGQARTTVDPELLRVMRFMALIKGVFAVAALAGSFWRLGRPAASWRTAVYVAGPPLMILGACGLFAMHDVGVAALALHLGLFAMLAAALTDREFLPDSALRRRPR